MISQLPNRDQVLLNIRLVKNIRQINCNASSINKTLQRDGADSDAVFGMTADRENRDFRP